MKIFVNARFLTQPVSGVQRYGIECCRQIKKLYGNVTFLSPGNILHTEIAEELEVKIIGRNTGHLWEQADLPFFMARQKLAPLLNLANTGPLLYSNNFVTLHDLAFHHHPEWNSKKFSAWYNILVPRLVMRSRHLFTVSQTIKNEIIACYGTHPDRITVTYNGISQAMMDQKAKEQPAKEKIILSVGTFNKRKNHQNLVYGFLESGLEHEYQLVIIGDKHKVFSETELNEQDLVNKNIKIYPSLSEQELIGLYQRAEVVVSLSLYEGFGIPVLEGLYNGCKIICSDIPVYRELYNQYARFCSPSDIEGIANQLRETTTNPSYISEEDMAGLFEKYNYKQSGRTIVDTIQMLNRSQ